jgi:hypothetical protein
MHAEVDAMGLAVSRQRLKGRGDAPAPGAHGVADVADRGRCRRFRGQGGRRGRRLREFAQPCFCIAVQHGSSLV